MDNQRNCQRWWFISHHNNVKDIEFIRGSYGGWDGIYTSFCSSGIGYAELVRESEE